MSKFTIQSYYSTAVKLLHCSITDTPIIHNTIQPGSETVLIWFVHSQQFKHCTVLFYSRTYGNRWQSMWLSLSAN